MAELDNFFEKKIIHETMSIIVYGVSSLLDSWLDISKFLLEFLIVIIFL